MSPIKHFFLFLTYLWLRFDPILRLTFKDNWDSRYEFLKNIFGEKDTKAFLKYRVELVEKRNKSLAPIITPNAAQKKVKEFLKTKNTTKSGREKRKQILNKLLFWALDQEINEQFTDSYKTRCTIIENLLNPIFQNALINETEQILEGLKKIVFSRVTYLGAKGEPSPIVHDTIISGVGRILSSHFSEVLRIRDENLNQMTKIKLIQEIQKSKEATGSLAFSGERKDDFYKNRFPLPLEYSQLLLKILNHYRYSAWSDSRDQAIKLIDKMENNLGFSLDDDFEF